MMNNFVVLSHMAARSNFPATPLTKEKSLLSKVGQQYAEETLAKHENPKAKAQMIELMRDF